MWIRTQNEHRIINSDQIIDIFVSKTETRIIAETTKEDVIVLGEYKDRDTCLKVLDGLFATHFTNGCTYRMPLGGEV